MMLSRRTLMAAAAAAPIASAVAIPSKPAPATRFPADLAVLLYPGFETIDAMGPVEMLAYVDGLAIRFVSLEGGVIKSAQGAGIETERFEPEKIDGMLLVPGAAPQFLKPDARFTEALRLAALKAQFVLTVCTGSLLLARTGLLDGRRATSNKNALPMVMKAAPKVKWQKRARWAADGKYFTSSGLTAGMDMALGFIAAQLGTEKARGIAKFMEYVWHEDPSEDPFAA